MNKYQRSPSEIIDLHGHTTEETRSILSSLLEDSTHSHVRIITGKGNHSNGAAVLREFTKKFLLSRGVRFSQSKMQDGGEGALEVFLKE
jgi:DNA-nicking Smr family endonuclease